MPEVHGSLTICPICAAPGARLFQRTEDRDLAICAACRHVFWRVMPSPAELTRHYTSVYTERHSQQHIQRSQIDYYRPHVDELVRTTGVEPARAVIADYGSSYPTFLQVALEARFSKAIGIEWDADARDEGRRGGITMLTPDEFERSTPPQSIDISRFSHVLEHLLDPLAVLRVVATRTKTGGYVYITQPNTPVLFAEACPQALADCVWPEHLHFFSPLSLSVLVRNAGLRVARLFTHQNAETVFDRFARHIDFAHAVQTLAGVSHLGDPFFGRLANYPHYAGENSVLYATRDRRSGRLAELAQRMRTRSNR